MSIKRILVPLPGTVDHSGEIDTALAAAKSLGADVEALFITQPLPPPTARMAAGGGYGYRSVASAVQLDRLPEERERQAREARERFVQACASAGIPMPAAGEAPGALPLASWREEEGGYVEVATKRAPAFDLVVAASSTVLASLKDIAERSLLRARRPVLLAPTRLEIPLTETAMIAWDESPECWHAVSAGLPFLQLAKSVQIVSVDRRAEHRSASQAEVAAYLRCHGIAASSRVAALDLRSVGQTLLAAAGEAEVGLLIMGAYSHSRLRETLIGGVTRHILQNAAARPVLLMH
jgi:nucleotide-binding universal stress UspA family protein